MYCSKCLCIFQKFPTWGLEWTWKSGAVKLLIWYVKCYMCVVFSGEHVRIFQQIPKEVVTPHQKKRLKSHWFLSFSYGLVPDSLSFITYHFPICYTSSTLTLCFSNMPCSFLPEPFGYNFLCSLDLHIINSAQVSVLEMVFPWSPNLESLPQSLPFVCVASVFRLYNCCIDWVLKQQALISHSSGGWRVQDQGAACFSF